MLSQGKLTSYLPLPASRFGRALLLAVLTGVYFAAGKFGLDMAYIHKSASAIWPPTGISLAAFLLWGRPVWPAIFVGAFLVNLTTAGTMLTSLAIATGNTLEGVIAADLVQRYAGAREVFHHARNVVRYMVLVAGATAISATVGTTTLMLGDLAAWDAYARIWLTWWLGDASAALLVAPALVLAMTEAAEPWTFKKIVEASLLISSVIVVGFFAFRGLVPAPLALCVPFPLWAAFRFGRREAAATVLVFAIFAIWGTTGGSGPFLRPARHESILVLQAFMGGLAVMSLTVAAVVAERRRVERELRAARAELQATVTSLHDRTAELTRSNEALKQFAYAASHDLQEPARTIGNYAEILERRYRGKLDANADEFLGYVVEGAKWIQQLLEGLLEYSRVERDRDKREPVPMGRAMDQALSNLGAAIAESGARIHSGPLPTVWADNLQMVQLLQNVFSNAVKFRRPGVTPEVRVEAWSIESEWVFAVRDNGIGVDTRYADRMFAIFQRLHPRDTYPGRGIGLAICKKIIELHGGRIWVESGPAGGTTLLFSLPRSETES
jgi:signal transduction histidine kinase